MPRYTTSGIPPHLAAGSELGLSAFMPHFNRLAASGAQCYKGQVVGRPGTQAIPVHPDNKLGGGAGLNDLAMAGTARSSDAPDMIWPNQYFVTPDPGWWPGAGMPIQMFQPDAPELTTMIPVPATDLRGVYLARSAALSGGVAPGQGKSRRSALKQATAFVRWPQRRTGNGPGTGSP